MLYTPNQRHIDDITADYDAKFAEITKITSLARSEKREMTSDEVAQFDTLDCEIRCLLNEKNKVDKDAITSQRLVDGISSGSIQVPDFMRPGSGTSSPSLRSRSGRPIAIASGPKQRLTKNPVSGHLLGELVRAAAVGVSAFTPDAVKMALRSDDNSKGGYSVPDLWLSDWIDRAVEQTTIAAYSTRQIMDSESLNITTVIERPTIATKAELEAFDETDMTFGNSRLQAFLAGAIMKASLEMLEDSPNAAAQVEAVSIRSMIDWLNSTMLNGTGSGEPLGILNTPDLPTTGTVGDITWDAIADAVTSLRSEIYTPNLCVVSPAIYNALHLQRELTAGDGSYLPRPQHLADLNIMASSHCPDAKIVLGDFTQLIMGIRQGARVEVSAEAGDVFERNAVAIRLKVRADWVTAHKKAFYALTGVTVPA